MQVKDEITTLWMILLAIGLTAGFLLVFLRG